MPYSRKVIERQAIEAAVANWRSKRGR